MKARPILFSGPMVRALLTGAKTQTRRVVKWPKSITERDISEAVRVMNRSTTKRICERGPCDGQKLVWSCPYGQPGDLLWVRETWVPRGTHWGQEKSYITTTENEVVDKAQGVEYRDDWLGMDDDICWKPSIFMPHWASRTTLRITDIRVQRLQDISEEDARAEGAESLRRYADRGGFLGGDHIHGFYCVWQGLNAQRGFDWGSNPWVWALTFEVIKANFHQVLQEST